MGWIGVVKCCEVVHGTAVERTVVLDLETREGGMQVVRGICYGPCE
jgi:hypothetical protein